MNADRAMKIAKMIPTMAARVNPTKDSKKVAMKASIMIRGLAMNRSTTVDGLGNR